MNDLGSASSPFAGIEAGSRSDVHWSFLFSLFVFFVVFYKSKQRLRLITWPAIMCRSGQGQGQACILLCGHPLAKANMHLVVWSPSSSLKEKTGKSIRPATPDQQAVSGPKAHRQRKATLKAIQAQPSVYR